MAAQSAAAGFSPLFSLSTSVRAYSWTFALFSTAADVACKDLRLFMDFFRVDGPAACSDSKAFTAQVEWCKWES